MLTNRERNQVALLETATGDVLAAVDVGESPTGLSSLVGTGRVCVGADGSDEKWVISSADPYRRDDHSGPKPHHMHESADGRFVYAACSGANRVSSSTRIST